MTDAPGTRASDADRTRAAGLLQRHYLDGRLTDQELNDRLAEAYAARTLDDLRVALRELPPLMPPRPDEVARSLDRRQRPGLRPR